MFNLEAKAATLLGAYQGTADLIETLACLEGQSDVPDEDVALAMAHLSRAMAALSSARSFCVDLCPSKDCDTDELLERCAAGARAMQERATASPPLQPLSEGHFFAREARARFVEAAKEDALPRAQQAGLEAVEAVAFLEGIPILNRHSPDRPVRFNVDGVYVWARTRDEAEQILAETRAALGEEVKP